MIKGYEYNPANRDPWVFVPREPAAFGHLIVISGKHYRDISDAGLLDDPKYLKKILVLINKLTIKLKRLRRDGKKCERVYVSTLCETENFHLHFHLIPRFEDDPQGFAFLFRTELEAARWLLENETSESKNPDGYKRTKETESLTAHNHNLLSTNRWARSNDERKHVIQEIKKSVEAIL